MATFRAWLDTQQDRQDDIGALARRWATDPTRAGKPVSSPSGMGKHIREHWPADEVDRWIAVLSNATDERHRQAAGEFATPEPPDPSQPALRELLNQLLGLHDKLDLLLASQGLLNGEAAIRLPDFGELFALADLTAEGDDE